MKFFLEKTPIKFFSQEFKFGIAAAFEIAFISTLILTILSITIASIMSGSSFFSGLFLQYFLISYVFCLVFSSWAWIIGATALAIAYISKSKTEYKTSKNIFLNTISTILSLISINFFIIIIYVVTALLIRFLLPN